MTSSLATASARMPRVPARAVAAGRRVVIRRSADPGSCALASIAVTLLVAVVDAARGFPSGGFYLLYGGVAIVFIARRLADRRAPARRTPSVRCCWRSAPLFAWYLPADLYLQPGPATCPGQDLAALVRQPWTPRCSSSSR